MANTRGSSSRSSSQSTSAARGGTSRRGSRAGRPIAKRTQQGKGGPRKPRYMLRRLIVLAALLAVLGGLVWAGVAIVRSVMGISSDSSPVISGQSGQSAQSAQSPTANFGQSGARLVDGLQIPAGGELTPDGIVDADGLISVPDCSNTQLSLNTSSTRTGIGEGAQIPVALKHNGTVACAFSAPQLQVKVTAGTSTIYDSSHCAQSPTEDAKMLLMTPGKQWQSTLAWDGRIYDGCSAVDQDSDGQADVADADTYQVTVSLGKQQSTANIIVE